LAAALVVLAALAGAGRAAADSLRVGIADDWPKFHPCGDVWWQSSKDIGYQDLRMTVQWDGSGAVPFAANIEAAVDCALLNNVRPILAIYPAKPAMIGSSDSAQNAFASFVALVGQTFPKVKNFVVGNEPNVNRFWQPQFVNGQDAAGKDYEHTLAKSYDALKQVRPDSIVWGPAISSRGNDNANATSNPSHSPVWFIKDMGDAYRASGRTTPIFDEFNMHPYPPIQDTDPFTKPFLWPQAGAANLDRIKQALWDAFNGTGQPVPAEQPGGRTAQSARFAGGLPIDLDEVGEQTVVTGHEGAYTNPPESIAPISEAQQAKNYTDLMELAACDPSVKALLFFPLIDEQDLNQGFQSGELFADLAHKQSYDAVKTKIATAHGNCQGGIPDISQAWVHTTSVIGAQAIFGGPGTQPGSAPPNAQATERYWAFSVTTSEDATYKAGIFPAANGAPSADDVGRALASARRHAVTPAATVDGTAHAYFKPLVRFPANTLPAGTYAYGVLLTAAVNGARSTTLVSPTFTVGTPAKQSPSRHSRRHRRRRRRGGGRSHPLTARTGVR
jgi:hypothetical protein